jgi:hypothetical protein
MTPLLTTAKVSNRVIRSYPHHSDYFIRVNFADENGERLGYDNHASNQRIYSDRFKKILRGKIDIAGFQYRFLGFSHSSLRSQSCWFCAPFEFQGQTVDPVSIIKSLGDFSAIRSPAKCAARIGQAFTDTTSAIRIGAENLYAMNDVERNDRVFSDGCGTISLGLLQRVWDSWTLAKSSRPTLLQIRFQGKSPLC